MSSRNHTALSHPTHDGKLHPSVTPQLARAFDGFFGPPARELRQNAAVSQDRRGARTPCESTESQASLPVYTVLGRY
ncbi:unnamed protein product [Rhizoctonia solani]|uniref:Uncharacterized protein n=1 Tax=Rhizoctonia solani TaxID=456999 RepID=A0A8H3A780_9AGAM